MYELKTILPTFDIELPTCMYTLRSNTLLQDTDTDTAKTTTNCNGSGSESRPDGSNNTSAIEQRQEKVLQQLNELKSQLADIRSQLGLCQKGVKHTQQFALSKGELIVDDPLHDIVINAHPKFIPYALLALKNAWSNIFNIDVKVFAHSTVPDIGDQAKDFQQKLCSGQTDPCKRGIKVTLIWTDCEHTEMIMSPTMYVPIYGEVNIIRYLGRVGPTEYRYELSPINNEIDLVLDICYQLLRCNTQKSKSDIIRLLTNRLSKEKFFGGHQLSVADIGVYSSLLRIKYAPKDLTPALKEWSERVKPFILL